MGLPPKDATAAVASEWQSQTCPHEMKNGTIRACYAISAGLVLLLLIIEAAMFFGWTRRSTMYWTAQTMCRNTSFSHLLLPRRCCLCIHLTRWLLIWITTSSVTFRRPTVRSTLMTLDQTE